VKIPLLHIGILGHSADGAALCFLEMVRVASERLGPHGHPEITLSILPMGPVLTAYDENDLDAVRRHLSRTASRLADAGCDFFACPDNTAHLALERDGEPLALPGLHMPQIVAAKAKAEGYRRVGLLGTKWTMEGSLYPRVFAGERIEMCVPSASDQVMVNRVIFDELCQGALRDESRREYQRVIDGFRGEGCEAVALCCTEIPLLVPPEASSLPTLSSTHLLAREAIDRAVAGTPPAWRGGAVRP
jgi:aspartate racemase